MNNLSFEKAYARLEQILQQMNSGKVSLDECLKLYEEADQLIAACNLRLNEAEQKIEILSKNKNGQLCLDEQGKPISRHFLPESQPTLQKSSKDETG